MSAPSLRVGLPREAGASALIVSGSAGQGDRQREHSLRHSLLLPPLRALPTCRRRCRLLFSPLCFETSGFLCQASGGKKEDGGETRVWSRSMSFSSMTATSKFEGERSASGMLNSLCRVTTTTHYEDKPDHEAAN